MNMVHAFQDRDNLYLVMDLLTGGDLRFHLNKHKKFTEEQTSRFLMGMMGLGKRVHCRMHFGRAGVSPH